MPITAPPGPLSRTWNMRTEPPGVTDAGAGAAEKLDDHGATVLQPSSALSATVGSPVALGWATGMLRVRSVVPWRRRVLGQGMTAVVGAKGRAIRAGRGAGSAR